MVFQHVVQMDYKYNIKARCIIAPLLSFFMHPIILISAAWRLYALVNYPSLVQIVACRMNGTEPLSERMLE